METDRDVARKTADSVWPVPANTMLTSDDVSLSDETDPEQLASRIDQAEPEAPVGRSEPPR
jgi:hypothetical protein